MKRYLNIAAVAVTIMLAAVSGLGETVQRTIDISADKISTGIKMSDSGVFSTVSYPGADRYTSRPGRPMLPVMVVRFALPFNATVTTVQATTVNATTIQLQHPLFPAQQLVPLDGSPAPAFTAPLDSVYRQQGLYPAAGAAIASVRALSEYRIVEVEVYPVRYDPASLQVSVSHQVTLSLEYTTDKSVTAPAIRRSVGSQAALEDRVRSMVCNAGAVASLSAAAGVTVIAAGRQPDGTMVSAADSSQGIDYIIITSLRLAASFSRLAQWRSRTGLTAAIRTVESIDSCYTGTDRCERIRRFIQDSWAKTGTMFFLIGGAPSVVPVRYVPWTAWPGYIPDQRIPTDLYYSDIVDVCYGQDLYRYDYNANHNGQYGELGDGGDQIDLQPDVFLGRAPVETPEQAATFVDKVLRYEQEPPAGFGSSFLTLAGGEFAWLTELVNTDPLATQAPWIDPYEMYNPVSSPGLWSGDELLNHASAAARMDQGYNLVYHFDHGGIYSLGTAVTAGGGWLYRTEAQALTNAVRPSIIVTPACSPNAFDYQCFSSALMNNPRGGAVAFIGNSRVGFTDQYWQCQTFFAALFRDHAMLLGQAFNSLIAAGWNYEHFSMNLMGDPAMPVWTNEARPVAVSCQARRTRYADQVTVTVTDGGAGDTALVCLQNDDDIHAQSRIAIPGSATYDIDPQHAGYLYLTATGRNLRPCRDSVLVAPLQPVLAGVTRLTCFDGTSAAHATSGNHDFVINPGETVELYPDIAIDSAAALSKLTVTLSSLDGRVQVIRGTAEFAYPRPGQTLHNDTLGGQAFVIRASAPLPSSEVPVQLEFRGMTNSHRIATWHQAASLAIRSDSLVYQYHRLTVRTDHDRPRQQTLDSESGHTVRVIIDSITIANLGDGAASGITARLSPVDPRAPAADGTVLIGSIAPRSQAIFPSALSLEVPDSPAPQILARLIVSDNAGRSIIQPVKLCPATAPINGVYAAPVPGGIRVSWTAAPGACSRGYRVYRATAAGSGPRELTATLVESATQFIDTTAQSDHRYLYGVAAVDSFGNQSAQLLCGDSVRPQPVAKPGFPVAMGIGGWGTRMWGSPAIGDINGDGRAEIVMGSDDGKLYAIDGRGQALPGWPVAVGAQIDNSTPALADIDADGHLEVIMGTGAWYTAAGDGRVHAFRGNGTEAPGWPQSVIGDAFASCAVADINNDSRPEIVAATTAGYVYVWSGTGQLLPGWPQTVGNRVAASPALGDLAHDGHQEIIVLSTSNGSLQLNVLSADGSSLAGWPRIIPGNAGYALSSPALADLDGDGRLEIVQAGGAEPPYGTVRVHAYKLNGSEADGWPVYVSPNTSITASPVIGDLNRDGKPDVVICTSDGVVHAFTNRGMNAMPWQTNIASNGRTNPVIADIDGNGTNDVVLTTESGYVHALDGATGAAIPGFPLWIESSWSAPAVGDIDGDGSLDLVATGWGSHKINAWSLGITATASSNWASFHGDNNRTGCYIATTTVAQAAPQATASAPLAATPRWTNTLNQNHPNPVVASTEIGYDIAEASVASLVIYNLNGQAVRTVMQGVSQPGSHSVKWDLTNDQGQKVSAGVYLYRLRIKDEALTRKMIVVR